MHSSNPQPSLLDSTLTWAEIDLDAIAFNVRAFKRLVGADVEIFAVVKANAYGHGAVPVARVALEAGASRLAVHRAIEAIELRKQNITAPILVMGYTPVSGASLAVDWQLTPTVTTWEYAQALSAIAAAAGVVVPVHIKIDTGMNRFGIYPAEVIPLLEVLKTLPAIRLEGIFTHLATANWRDQTYVRQQLADFRAVLSACRHIGIEFPLVHAANSAAAMRLPQSHFNAIRPGIALYGLTPSDEWQPSFEIKPALSLKSRICRVRDLPAGCGISYSRTFITTAPNTRVALVPVGYGDGYHRILSNKGQVLIHGQRASILGRVCMDQFVVDVSQIPHVQYEDEVTLIGKQGEDEIRAEEIARLAGTINYEITTSLLPRIVRVYHRSGEISAVDITDLKKIEQDEREQRTLAEALQSSAEALTKTLNLDEVLDAILLNAGKVVPHDTATLMLVEDGIARIARQQGYEERGILSYAQSFRFPVDQIDNLRQMAETGKPMAIPDTHQHPGWVSFPEIEYIRSFSGAPINIKGRVVGFINLDSATANFFNQTHAERLMAFAHQAAIAIENAQLHTQVQQMAVTDFLTGMYNRRGFSELSEREMERARRFKRPLALLFLDIDHFKRINDQYGHLIGDQVLQQIANRLVQNLRSIDLFSRFGGEEFAILLPDTDNAAARLTAERLRLSIEAEPIPTERAPLNLTVSIGVASLEDETPDLRTLIEKADQALYQAKQGGRNRVA